MLEYLISPSKASRSLTGVKMKNNTLGNWTYNKSNHTVQFKCKIWRQADNDDGPNQKIGPYSYEVDLDRYSVEEWTKHLRETKGKVMTDQDLYDLNFLCQRYPKTR